MSHNFLVITIYFLAVSLVTQVVVLGLQLRCWQRTRHPSLIIVAGATSLGILFLILEAFLAGKGKDPQFQWDGYWVLAGLSTVQAIVAIWGVVSLFAAFEATLRASGKDPHRTNIEDATSPHPASDNASELHALLPPPASAWRSMLALIRWLTWRPFDARAFDAPDFVIAGMAVLCVGLAIGLERIGLGPAAEISLFSVQILACRALGLLGVGWIIWRVCHPQASWRSVLFILAGLTALAVPLRWGIDHLGAGRTLASWGLLCLQLLLLTKVLKVVTGVRQLRAVSLSFIALLLGTAIMVRYLGSGPIWYVPDAEVDRYTRSANEAERLFMIQPARIDTAIAAMAPRSGAQSAYMVGFAGVGEQKVFAGEISLAAKVIAQRHDTQKRTLLLVNDQRDLESQPLASVTGLKLALTGIGRRMDPERDVLFLVISSHGSQAPAISVSNGGIPLNDLTGKDLKEALDGSGIRWRVIIISACHAGAFIPFLRNDQTIVIAAAAPDRASFGCSNERDLTDFGEAFIRDAWPSSPTLRIAFEKARAAIAARELKEHLTPSMPTAYFGPAIEERLSGLESDSKSP